MAHVFESASAQEVDFSASHFGSRSECNCIDESFFLIAKNIESKVNKIISLYNFLKKEKEEILEKNKTLKSEVEDRDKDIKMLEEKIKLLRITKSVSTLDVEKNKESRQKINEYVREIDKCIALLNK